MAQWQSNLERLPNMLEALSLILNGNKTKYSIYRKQEESMDGGREHKRYPKAKKECRFKSNLIEDYSKHSLVIIFTTAATGTGEGET